MKYVILSVGMFKVAFGVLQCAKLQEKSINTINSQPYARCFALHLPDVTHASLPESLE